MGARDKLIVAGVDISMSNLALAVHNYDIRTGKLGTPFIKLFSTESTSKKAKVRRNSDDLERARVLYKGLQDTLDAYGVHIVCVEMPVGSQNSRAAASYGMSVGLVASISMPLIQVLPTDVKMAIGSNSKIVSKQHMINWAVARYPKAAWLKQGQRIIAKNEHMADACAAVVAGMKYDEFKLLTAVRSR